MLTSYFFLLEKIKFVIIYCHDEDYDDYDHFYTSCAVQGALLPVCVHERSVDSMILWRETMMMIISGVSVLLLPW